MSMCHPHVCLLCVEWSRTAGDGRLGSVNLVKFLRTYVSFTADITVLHLPYDCLWHRFWVDDSLKADVAPETMLVIGVVFLAAAYQ